jgi:hypothetical protein
MRDTRSGGKAASGGAGGAGEALEQADGDGIAIIHFGPPADPRLPGRSSAAAHQPADGPAAGPRSRPRLLPRLRRAQAQPARTSPAAQLRSQPRPDRHPGGLARRKPTPQEIGPRTRPLPERPRSRQRSSGRRTSRPRRPSLPAPLLTAISLLTRAARQPGAVLPDGMGVGVDVATDGQGAASSGVAGAAFDARRASDRSRGGT